MHIAYSIHIISARKLCVVCSTGMSQFVIVEFVDEKTVASVPASWITHDNKSAFWPGYVSSTSAQKAVRTMAAPQKSWKSFPVRIMGYAGLCPYILKTLLSN